MRSLVTGGAGFIGSNLVDALIARGDQVTVIDNVTTGKLVNLAGAKAAGAAVIEADIRHDEHVQDIMEEHRPQRIFHLAAQIDVRRSVRDPAYDIDINVGGTSVVLDAARRMAETGEPLPHVCFASTGGALYGEGAHLDLPLPESSAIAPLSPYGQDKYAAECYMGLYKRLYGLKAACLRLGNVYGPRQDPLGEAGVIAIFCGKLKAGEAPTVYGSGEQTRDYIYVGDVVSALLRASEQEAEGAFNIGTGIETSVLELIEGLRAAADGAAGESFVAQLAPARPGEVEAISLDPALAGSELGWRAETGLEQGLRLTLAAA